MVSQNIDASLALNTSQAAKDMVIQIRSRRDKPEDKIVNQNDAFNYLFNIQQTPSFVPDQAMLNAHLSWIAANKSTMAAADLSNLLNIVRNIVGSASHAMNVRLQLQMFKRQQMNDYSDTDPIEAQLFGDFNSMVTANTKADLDYALNDIQSVDSMIPT
jgi:hypothetical protein